MQTVTEIDTEDALAERYRTILHATCTFIPRRHRECDWASSGYCRNCGRPIPTLLPGRPGTLE